MDIRYCSTCGTSIPTEERAKPHPTCGACGTTHWQNPKPVAVLVQPVVRHDGSTGLLAIQRGIEPFIGEWALPGGFIEIGETPKEAVVRELLEETEIPLVHMNLRVTSVTPTLHGQLLIFVRNNSIMRMAFVERYFGVTKEATGWRITSPDEALCFALHTQAAAEFHERG